MSITRLWQSGAEWHNTAAEFTTAQSNFVTSGTQAKTGSYSFRTEDTDYAAVDLSIQYNLGIASPSTSFTQLRVGFWVHNAGGAATELPRLISFRSGATETMQVLWDEDNSLFKIYDGVGATLLDSAAASAFAAGGSWVHIGIDVKIANAGWVYMYVNGAEIIGFDGDTNNTGTEIDTVLFGGVDDNWNQYIYYDDIYIDDTTGESLAQVAPRHLFLLKYPASQGVWNDWLGSDMDSTDNWAMVDDRPSDGDTTYIETDTGGLVDSSELSSVSVTGYDVTAVFPHGIMKRGTDSSLEMKLYTRDTDTANYGYSLNGPITTNYRPHFHERTVSINTVTWDQGELDNLEIGVATA